MGIPKTSLVAIVLLQVLVVEILATEYAPVVHTTKGPVKGIVLKTAKRDQQYFGYRNIRYAKAPVGYLRFKPPVEPEPWKKVLDVSEYGSICPQPSFQPTEKGYDGDEDCLNLSVFTPSIASTKGRSPLKPVMFWIFGGGFVTGNNRDTMYGPDYLIEEGVVVVIPNYRLGALGFLALEHQNATGNAGLKDQNLALRWVRDNIARFGGDPNRVTIAGESSGAAAVDLQMLSVKSRGLFHSAIQMSGTTVSIWATRKLQDAQVNAFQLAKNLGQQKTQVESLLDFYYNIDVRTLLDATTNLTDIDTAFKPVIEEPRFGFEEDMFLLQCPVKLFESGDYSQVPVMMGYTKDESLFNVGVGDLQNNAIGAIALLKYYGMEKDVEDVIAPLRGKYDQSTGVAILSDILFIAPAGYEQQLLSKWRSPIYVYRYNYDHPRSFHRVLFNLQVNGSAHADELPNIFNGTFYQVDPKSTGTPALVQSRMTRMWANLIKYGNPTPHNDALLDNVKWPDSRANGDMLDISDRLEVIPRYTSKRIQTIQSAMRTHSPTFPGCSTAIA